MGASAFLKSVDFRAFAVNVKTIALGKYLYQSGHAIWWYTMAPAVHTFLEGNDWKGKTVIPFMTNGGWPGHVICDIKSYCKGAEFICEKEIQFDSTGGDKLQTPVSEIERWIADVKAQS